MCRSKPRYWHHLVQHAAQPNTDLKKGAGGDYPHYLNARRLHRDTSADGHEKNAKYECHLPFPAVVDLTGWWALQTGLLRLSTAHNRAKDNHGSRTCINVKVGVRYLPRFTLFRREVVSSQVYDEYIWEMTLCETGKVGIKTKHLTSVSIVQILECG